MWMKFIFVSSLTFLIKERINCKGWKVEQKLYFFLHKNFTCLISSWCSSYLTFTTCIFSSSYFPFYAVIKWNFIDFMNRCERWQKFLPFLRASLIRVCNECRKLLYVTMTVIVLHSQSLPHTQQLNFPLLILWLTCVKT